MTRLTLGLVARHTPNGPQGRVAALIDIAQDLLLRELYSKGIFDHLVFKGGTALRKLYAGNAGRFSTDLDFSVRMPDEDVKVVSALLAEAIDGLEIEGFGYSVTVHRERPTVVYSTPFGGLGRLTTKLDVGPPTWLTPEERGWVRLPVHSAYSVPESIPVMALAENIAEKIARLNRLTPARDVYDLVWVASNSPHSRFDTALVRRLAVLKCWVDHQGLHSTTNSWARPPGSRAFDVDHWLRVRGRSEFTDESIGLLASPPPDLAALAEELASKYAFLADLDLEERKLLRGEASDRASVIAAIKELPGGRLSTTTLW
jgi:uncharacterized protein